LTIGIAGKKHGKGGSTMRYVHCVKRRFLGLHVLAFFGVFVALTTLCYGQEFPTRAIDLVIPNPPGGGVDTFFRTVQEPMAKELKVPVNVVNRAGGGGVVGSSFVANSRPDGYTLLGQEVTSFIMPQLLTPKTVPFDVLKDFKPIAHFAYEPSVFVARLDAEYKTVEELVSYALKNPGKILAGTSGIGTLNRLNLELFKIATSTNIRFVSFSGGGEVLVNLLGGHVDITFATLASVRPHIKAAKLRVLAAMTPQRLAELPDVPTLREKGIPDVNLSMYYAVFGPKTLPQTVAEKISRSVGTILASPENRANLDRHGYVIDFLSTNQLEERMAKSFDFCTDLTKKAKLMQE
jgi:tripartite-type tricarboxylate transporter receptor subunit TctC